MFYRNNNNVHESYRLKHGFKSFICPIIAISTALKRHWDSTLTTMGQHSCNDGTLLMQRWDSTFKQNQRKKTPLLLRDKEKTSRRKRGYSQKNLISFISAFPRDKLILRRKGCKETTTPILQYSVEIIHEKFVIIRVKKINMKDYQFTTNPVVIINFNFLTFNL